MISVQSRHVLVSDRNIPPVTFHEKISSRRKKHIQQWEVSGLVKQEVLHFKAEQNYFYSIIYLLDTSNSLQFQISFFWPQPSPEETLV